MAVMLEANYSKKLGLPEYSSHQFSVSIRSELSDLQQVPEESARLYDLLQTSVDNQIRNPGFLPGNGSEIPPSSANRISEYKQEKAGSAIPDRPWRCSEKQAGLIRGIIAQNNLDEAEVDELSHSLFGKCLPDLNKLEASGLIDRLLEQYGRGSKSRPNPLARHNRLNSYGRASVAGR